MSIVATGHDGNPVIILDSRHIDISEDTMDEYDDRETFNDVESFGAIIRQHFDGMIDIASDGEVQQVSDEELVIFNGYGFRVHLSNGASFDIQIQQRDFADAT